MCDHCVAFELYEAMNALDCGCTGNFQESVSLESGNWVQFEEKDNGKFNLIILDPSKQSVLKEMEVDWRASCDEFCSDRNTYMMFRELLADSTIE